MPSALQIKVLWQGRSPEWDEMDGGAFAKWMQACEEEENQQRQIATALGVKAAVTIPSDVSQALPGLRPQVRTNEINLLQCTCFCWPGAHPVAFNSSLNLCSACVGRGGWAQLQAARTRPSSRGGRAGTLSIWPGTGSRAHQCAQMPQAAESKVQEE